MDFPVQCLCLPHIFFYSFFLTFHIIICLSLLQSVDIYLMSCVKVWEHKVTQHTHFYRHIILLSFSVILLLICKKKCDGNTIQAKVMKYKRIDGQKERERDKRAVKYSWKSINTRINNRSSTTIHWSLSIFGCVNKLENVQHFSLLLPFLWPQRMLIPNVYTATYI